MASPMAERAGPPAAAAAAAAPQTARRPSTLSEIRRSVKSRLRHLPSPSSSSHPPLRDRAPGAEGDDAAGYDIQAELVSRDKARQKEAVRRYLQSKVRNDWAFELPPRLPPPTAPAAVGSASAVEDDAAAVATAAKTPATVEGTLVTSSTSAAMDVAAGNISNGHDDMGEAGPSEQPPQNSLAQDNDKDKEIGASSTTDVQGSNAVKADEPIDSGAEADSDTESIYSVISDDPSQYRPRAEWISDISDDDEGTFMPTGPTVSPSPFRFDSPDSVGLAVQATSQAGREKRRRADRNEMAWNEGLACFNARRDAWTGARTVRLKPRPLMSPTSPTSPRRRDKLFRFRSSHGEGDAVMLASPTSTTTTASSTTTAKAQPTGTLGSTTTTTTGIESLTPPASDGDSQHKPSSNILSPTATNKSQSLTLVGTGNTPMPSTYPIETILPVPPPLLPPNNPMRASITPALYLSIYDKVVAAAAQPSCPINLSDMIRSCVAAWKRDGEWPPRPANMMGMVHQDPMMTGVMMPTTGAAAAARARRRVEKEREQRRQETMRKEAGGGAGGGHGRRMSFAGLIGRRNSAAGVDGVEGGGANPTAGEDERLGIRKSFRKILHIGHHAPAPGSTAAATSPGLGG